MNLVTTTVLEYSGEMYHFQSMLKSHQQQQKYCGREMGKDMRGCVCVSWSYHALFWDRSLDFAADHLGQSRAVLWGSEAPLGLCSTGFGGGNPRRLAPSLVHVHVQSVPLPRCTLGKRVNGLVSLALYFCINFSNKLRLSSDNNNNTLREFSSLTTANRAN